MPAMLLQSTSTVSGSLPVGTKPFVALMICLAAMY